MSKDASVIIISAVLLVVNILQRNQIEELDQRITDLESISVAPIEVSGGNLENRVTTLEYRSDIFEEMHKKDQETDDLQTMAIGAIIKQITEEKEDWQ